jgi:integrase
MSILATMAIPTLAIPDYQRNPATGRAFATFGDRSLEFGPYDDPQSHAAYDQTLARWLANGRRLPPEGPWPPTTAGGSGSFRSMPWAEFSAELLSLYHISMRANATKRGMQQAIGSLTALGVTSTCDLTTGLIAKWVAAQKTTVSPNSTKGRLRYVQRLCNYAFSQGYISINPFVVAPLRTWVRSVPPTVKKYHSREEISRVLAEMKRLVDTSDGWRSWRSRRLFALSSVLAALGLRANEAYHLYAVDIDLSARVLHVVARTKRLKTASSQADLPICPWLIPILEDWMSHRMDVPPGFVHDEACPWLFPASRRKAPWTSGSAGQKPRDRMVAVGKSVGVEGFNPLSLRHSAATNLTAIGGSPNLVRLLLRHTNNATGMWYTHSSLSVLREGVERISF